MPLQIRRGTTAERLTITPLPGELIYDTTTEEIYVGDGVTAGGQITTGISIEDASDAAAALFTSGVHTGISFNFNDTNNRIDASIVGPLSVDLNGSVIANNDTVLVDAETGTIPWSVISGAPSIPTNTNQLTNGANFITLAQVPPIPETISSFFNDSGYITSSAIPTNISAFTNNSGYITSSAIPTNISAFTNDSGYITSNTDIKGSVFADDSTMLVDGVSGLLVGPLATSGLASNLNTNGRSIVSVSNQNITIEPNGSGAIVLGKNVFLLPNTRLSVSATTAAINQVEISSFHDATGNSSNFVFSRARGTTSAPAPVIDNDHTVDITFSAFSGTGYRVLAGILGKVDGPVTPSYIPGKIEFFTTDTAGVVENRFVFRNDGTLQVDNITGNLSSLSVTGDLIGSVFADDSTLIVDALENKINTNSVSLSQFLQLPIYADDAARLAGIPTPAQGMVIFMQTGTLPAATNQIQIFNGTNWITL
jgi:hypothetical protein